MLGTSTNSVSVRDFTFHVKLQIRVTDAIGPVAVASCLGRRKEDLDYKDLCLQLEICPKTSPSHVLTIVFEAARTDRHLGVLFRQVLSMNSCKVEDNHGG